MNEDIKIMTTVMRASSHRFVGRLGKDPEIKFLDGGKSVASGSIAINIPGSKQGDGKAPDWFKVDVWGEQAQAFADQCHKGDLVEVIGRVRTNRWTDRTTGEEKLDLVVTADCWSLVYPPGQGQQQAAGAPTAAPTPAAAQAPSNEDVPF
jgi:single-strand DNA-binding protein